MNYDEISYDEAFDSIYKKSKAVADNFITARTISIQFDKEIKQNLQDQ